MPGREAESCHGRVPTVAVEAPAVKGGTGTKLPAARRWTGEQVSVCLLKASSQQLHNFHSVSLLNTSRRLLSLLPLYYLVPSHIVLYRK